MALKVSVNSSSRVATNTIKTASKTQTSTTLGGLEGVNVADAEDGYALVFNEDNGQWEAAPTSSLAVVIPFLDGGTFQFYKYTRIIINFNRS